MIVALGWIIQPGPKETVPLISESWATKAVEWAVMFLDGSLA
jgi:hypothetical protein